MSVIIVYYYPILLCMRLNKIQPLFQNPQKATHNTIWIIKKICSCTIILGVIDCWLLYVQWQLFRASWGRNVLRTIKIVTNFLCRVMWTCLFFFRFFMLWCRNYLPDLWVLKVPYMYLPPNFRDSIVRTPVIS